MNPQIKTLWIDALESGKYKQGAGSLKKTEKFSGETFHCCLGVLCELAVAAGVELNVETPAQAGYEEYWLFDNGYEVLPHRVKEWAGMNDNVGTFMEDNESLAELNDNGTPFNDIANVIRENF